LAREPRTPVLLPIAIGAILALILIAALALVAQPKGSLVQATGTPAVQPTAIAAATTSIPVSLTTTPPSVVVPPALAQAETPTLTKTIAPTATSVPLAPAIPAIPRGEISYPVPSEASVTQLKTLFAPTADITTFYNNHSEIHCASPRQMDMNCLPAGVTLNLKWEELDPAPVGLEAQREPGRTVWLAVRVDDSVLGIIKGTGDLTPYKGKWVLLRGAWQAGVFTANPQNLFFVEQGGKYYPYGQVPSAVPTVKQGNGEIEAPSAPPPQEPCGDRCLK
jgi:hypothetical protein